MKNDDKLLTLGILVIIICFVFAMTTGCTSAPVEDRAPAIELIKF